MRYLIICGLLTVSNALSGQTLRQYITAAHNALAEEDFYTAYTHLETAINVDSTQYDLRYLLGETARKYHAYSEAEREYAVVLNNTESDEFPAAAFHLGEMQMIQGKYDSAIASFQIYLSDHSGEDSTLTTEANRLIESAQWAKDHLGTAEDSTKAQKLGDTINTLYSEFGALKTDELIYFTRLGYERMKMDEKGKREVPPALLYAKVLKSSADTTAGQELDETLNDSTLHTAHITFNHEGTRLYYTLCEYLNKSDVRCDLYYRNIVDSVWGEPQKLPEPINADSFTSTQPNIAYDDRLGKEVLYFVSNRDGGSGNLDIWYAVVNDTNSFEEPVNLSAVNTPHDDLAPFFHEESNTMYFSTDGRNGYGGYDVFRAEQNEAGDLMEPENVGPAVNSSYHDVYYTLEEDESEAMFSSNRVSSYFLEESRQACCYDVYHIQQKPIEVDLIVEVFNKRTGEPLTDVTLYITSRNGRVVQVTQTTADSNSLRMPLNRNKQYTVVGEKEDFEPDSVTFSTYNINESTEIRKKLYLNPDDVVLVVRTFDRRQKQPLPNVRVTLFDDAKNILDQKQHEFTHLTYFFLPPKADYQVMGWRKGYLRDSARISAAELVDVDTVIKDLYLELGNLEDFLPLEIYFDNDHPNPNSQSETTELRYLETYTPYYNKKDVFREEYSAGLTGDEKQVAEQKIEVFFEDSLRVRMEEFKSFLNILHQYLDDSLSFTIFLKGYTSPLASESYNYKLGQRRIKTIQNEFAEFRGGVLKKYFESGDLQVLEKSFGEEEAPPGVSDSPANKRLSIYSPEASHERRCEIIEIEKDNPQQ